jgi:transposase-like protein
VTLRGEAERRKEAIDRQHKAGRTGGGPECPMCGDRALRTMPLAAGPGMYLCTTCGYGVTVRVGGPGLEVRAISRG